MIGNFIQSYLHVGIGRHDLWLLGRGHLPREGGGFSKRRKEDLQLNERRIRKFGFVYMRAMFRNRQSLGATARQATDLSG